jgi:hypothetical protein
MSKTKDSAYNWTMGMFDMVVVEKQEASKLQKYRRPADYWLMKPFTLGELIQASVFLASISSFVH